MENHRQLQLLKRHIECLQEEAGLFGWDLVEKSLDVAVNMCDMEEVMQGDPS